MTLSIPKRPSKLDTAALAQVTDPESSRARLPSALQQQLQVGGAEGLWKGMETTPCSAQKLLLATLSNHSWEGSETTGPYEN